MNIFVKSRAQAREDSYRLNDSNIKKAIISISTPGDENNEFNSANKSIKGILFLQFHDIGVRDSTGIPISDNDAKQIAKFARWCEKTGIEELWVHCDAGISRSAGVAAALMKYFNGDDSYIFDSGHYLPNFTCYSKVLEALMEDN